MNKGDMTMAEAGKLGGQSTRDKMLAKDPDFYRKLGRKGGAVTKARYGPEFYQNIGAAGGAKRALVAAGASGAVKP